MTTTSPGGDTTRTNELLSEVQASLRDLRRAFRALKERVEAGEEVKRTEVNARLSDLTNVLVNCNKLETRLAEQGSDTDKRDGGQDALSLERARAEVLCALGRLRKCGGSGAVSG